jgi:predicted transposase/invertase (TIGR01784 family)
MAKKYEELTFNDDFMFCKILEQKPALCRELLELVLDRKVGELVGVNPQKPIEITANGKGVRFDVYAEGSDSIIYDIEMQNASTDSIAKRSRYSQGMIDLNLIKRGAHYSDLNRSYVIYICRFNLFEEIGRHKYSFLNYIASGMPSDGFTNELENEVQKARDHIQWRTEYMTFLEQLERERNEGREEGRAEERVNTERERERADAAENRAEAAEDRAEAAEDRANGLEKEVLELRKQLESLIHK